MTPDDSSGMAIKRRMYIQFLRSYSGNCVNFRDIGPPSAFVGYFRYFRRLSVFLRSHVIITYSWKRPAIGNSGSNGDVTKVDPTHPRLSRNLLPAPVYNGADRVLPIGLMRATDEKADG